MKDQMTIEEEMRFNSGATLFILALTLTWFLASGLHFAVSLDKPEWVDPDVNLLRYKGKLYRAIEVKRPLIKVEDGE